MGIRSVREIAARTGEPQWTIFARLLPWDEWMSCSVVLTKQALTGQAGQIESPFDNWDVLDAQELRHDPRQIVNNALVYAAGWGQQEAMRELLNRGAEVNAIPAGFDFAGTPLHYASLHGRRHTVDWLLQHGADPAVRDAKIGNLPEDWAAHDGHAALAAYLKQRRQRG